MQNEALYICLSPHKVIKEVESNLELPGSNLGRNTEYHEYH
jgi:hypothetical protein